MPGVSLMVRVVGLGSQDPEFKSTFAVELIPGGVDSACHPSEVSKMSASLLVSCVRVAICLVLCQIAKETALAAPMLCTDYGPNGWMDGRWNIWKLFFWNTVHQPFKMTSLQLQKSEIDLNTAV